MKKILLFAAIFTLFCSFNKKDLIDPDLYYKYIEDFFTFQGECGKQYALNEKYVTQNSCSGSKFTFETENIHSEFFNNCSNNILDSYYEYVDHKLEINCTSNKDSIKKDLIERVKKNNEFKQCFYSIYCQYYNINSDSLFGIKIIKKDTLSIDSLENIALLAFTVDAIDSVERYTISHFCGSAGLSKIENISTKLIYYDLVDAIMNENVKNAYHKHIKALNTKSKERLIDGNTVEEIRTKVENILRMEMKKSGVLKEAIIASYEKKIYSPYIIKRRVGKGEFHP
jgi:hypothetical protein